MCSRPELFGQSWSTPLGFAIALSIAATVYYRGWSRLRTAFPELVPTWRLAAFVSGLLATWVALGSPLGTLHHAVLSAHMLQHLLLMTVADPLLLLGAPVLPLLDGLPPIIINEGVSPILRQHWMRRLGRVLSHPVTCLLAPSVTLIAWHLPPAFEFAMHSGWGHALQDASFFITGMLLWWPVVQPWPSVSKYPRWLIPVYLFLATLPCDALSAFLTFYDRVVYSCYRTAPNFFGRSPLADQQFAGALMWVCVTFIYMVPAVVITIQILSPAGVRRVASGVQMHNRPSADAGMGTL
jgi:cytochrome c oxidase assembly factor CtaG